MSNDSQQGPAANADAFLLGYYCQNPNTVRLQQLILRPDLPLSTAGRAAIQSVIDAINKDELEHSRDPWMGRKFNPLTERPPEFEVSSHHSSQLSSIGDGAFKAGTTVAKWCDVGKTVTTLLFWLKRRHEEARTRSAIREELQEVERQIEELTAQVESNRATESNTAEPDSEDSEIAKAGSRLEAVRTRQIRVDESHREYSQFCADAEQSACAAIDELPHGERYIAVRFRRFVDLLVSDLPLSDSAQKAFDTRLSSDDAGVTLIRSIIETVATTIARGNTREQDRPTGSVSTSESAQDPRYSIISDKLKNQRLRIFRFLWSRAGRQVHYADLRAQNDFWAAPRAGDHVTDEAVKTALKRLQLALNEINDGDHKITLEVGHSDRRVILHKN